MVNLTLWLKTANITQRDLAKRLGLKGNGFITLVNTGVRYVPGDDVPKWADALRLSGEERRAFMDECAADSVPEWHRNQLKEAELAHAQLVAQVVELQAQVRQLQADLLKVAADAGLTASQGNGPGPKAGG